MRILLDENLDWRLQRALPGHHVESVQRNGMAGLKNGALLTLAAKSFDVFVTMDGNIAFQHNFAALPLRIVALHARSNRLSETEPLMPKILLLVPTLKPGTPTVIGIE
jgi:predicted nuclease of predicted toxin-antitoxin system